MRALGGDAAAQAAGGWGFAFAGSEGGFFGTAGWGDGQEGWADAVLLGGVDELEGRGIGG